MAKGKVSAIGLDDGATQVRIVVAPALDGVGARATSREIPNPGARSIEHSRCCQRDGANPPLLSTRKDHTSLGRSAGFCWIEP